MARRLPYLVHSRGRDGVRPRFCFLLASLHTGASVDMWRGVAEEAEARDVDLVALPAGRLDAADEHEYMRNYLAGLARPGTFDGVLSWASSLSGACAPGRIEALHAAFGELPLVALAQPSVDAPSVSVDAYGGMRRALDHLALAHGYSRIAFIRGPESHVSAGDRLRAYADFHAERGLPHDPALVSSPLPWDEGAKAVAEFLDERRLEPGKDFQAVATASDLLAFWFVRGLEARGYRIPADVAVVGFNDSPESRLVSPPLTTAAMPFAELGRRGLSALVEYWESGERPADALLPASLVVRESCGCPSAEIERAGRFGTGAAAVGASAWADGERGAEGAGAIAPDAGLAAVEGLASAAVDEAVGSLGVAIDIAEAWIRPLAQSFRDELRRGAGTFLPMLGKVLERSGAKGSPELPWQDLVSSLERATTGSRQAAALVSKARVMIGQSAYRASAYRQWEAEESARRLGALGRSLLSTYAIDDLADALAAGLSSLGFRHAYLSLASAAAGPCSLRLAMRDGERATLPESGLELPSPLDLPRELLPRGRSTLSAEPLFAGGTALGCLVIDATSGASLAIEELRGMVSTAVNGARLFAEAAEAKAKAEKADALKTRLIANVGHELRAPLGLIVDEAGALSGGAPGGAELAKGLARIVDHARHEARVVGDLLDLSLAEIGELDLAPEWVDPGALAAECVEAFSADGRHAGSVEWAVDAGGAPLRVRSDPVRVRQILFNLLDNARKHSAAGRIEAAVRAEPPWVAISVTDSGSGIDPGLLGSIFEPFVGDGAGGGLGLGLSISRRMATLLGGRLDAESRLGEGSRFTLRLPLPTLGTGRPGSSGQGLRAPEAGHAAIDGSDTGKAWTADAGAEAADAAIAGAADGDARRRVAIWLGRSEPASSLLRPLAGLGLSVEPAADWDARGGAEAPWAVLVDPSSMDAAAWATLRRLRGRARLAETPVLLFGPEAEPGSPRASPMAAAALLEGRIEDALALLGSPALIVDDDPDQRARLRSFFGRHFPDMPLDEAADADGAIESMSRRPPAVVTLDLGLPGRPGEAVLEYMKSEERLRHTPTLVISGRALGEGELARLDGFSKVAVLVKGVWTDDELAAIVRAALRDELPDCGPAVKKALAYVMARYGRPMTRSSLAEAVGVNEDHLSRMFHRELGLGIWDFLNRYRVAKAKELLAASSMPVAEVAARVGFSDASYFCRVFRKLSGSTPQAYRDGAGSR